MPALHQCPCSGSLMPSTSSLQIPSSRAFLNQPTRLDVHAVCVIPHHALRGVTGTPFCRKCRTPPKGLSFAGCRAQLLSDEGITQRERKSVNVDVSPFGRFSGGSASETRDASQTLKCTQARVQWACSMQHECAGAFSWSSATTV